MEDQKVFKTSEAQRLANLNWRARNKKKRQQSAKEYHEENREDIHKKAVVYREVNKAELKEKRAIRYQINKERYTLEQAIRNKEKPLNRILTATKNSAKRRGIEFNLVLTDIPQPTHCPVFGFELIYGGGTGKTGPTPNSASLDRINSSKGYIPSNIQVISWRANKLKNDATLEELEAICAYIRTYS